MTTLSNNLPQSTAPKNAHIQSKDSLSYWKQKIRKRAASPYYYIELQADGDRRKFSLQTSIEKAAAARAREISQHVRLHGWPATIQRYRPNRRPQEAAGTSLTVGQYVQQASKHSGASVRSVASYAKALRSICASLLGADANQAKYGRGRAGRKWRQEIDDMALASLTPERIREWKADYLQRGKQDPISKRSRKVSVNSLMRLAKSLFSKSILKNIGLPIVDPFADIEFEARQNTKYRGTFDARSLFEAAQAELAGVDPEAFKAFLLGLCAGLRRHEIDLLEWSSFRWREGVVRIETTEHFTAKSEDSLGDVALDPDVLELFKGYQTRASSEFVIESPFAPRPEARYSHYRCEPVFKRLGSWLKAHGIRARKPLHELRKEFGAILCNTPAGIYGASQMLRHSSVKITEMHYAQHRARITVSFSRPANVVAISEETNNLTSQAV